MNQSISQTPVNQQFDIHSKLKSTKSHWAYARAAQPHQDGFNYEFSTTFIDGVEFAIYERIDNYFVLVDFFNTYEQACEDAKKIIDSHPDLKKLISSRQI
ncbi:hypothetical protein SOJ85_004261 [Cronobacter turicensis]|nr:hypothetical protein [Cronobacter turicensis]